MTSSICIHFREQRTIFPKISPFSDYNAFILDVVKPNSPSASKMHTNFVGGMPTTDGRRNGQYRRKHQSRRARRSNQNHDCRRYSAARLKDSRAGTLREIQDFEDAF